MVLWCAEIVLWRKRSGRGAASNILRDERGPGRASLNRKGKRALGMRERAPWVGEIAGCWGGQAEAAKRGITPSLVVRERGTGKPPAAACRSLGRSLGRCAARCGGRSDDISAPSAAVATRHQGSLTPRNRCCCADESRRCTRARALPQTLDARRPQPPEPCSDRCSAPSRHAFAMETFHWHLALEPAA